MTMPAIAEETLAPQEDKTIERFIAFMEEVSRKRNPTGTIKRFNQGRAAGCVHAEFSVLGTLPPEHRVGLFAEPRTYAAWIRFANASSKTDRDRDVRGMSIKVFDVPGENLTAGETAQDFVLNSHPVMVAPNTSEFLDLLQALEGGRLRMAGYFLTHPKAALIGVRAQQNPSCHLDIPYWSTTPYLFGSGRAVKYHVRPPAGASGKHTGPVTETYLTDALKTRLAGSDASFDFMVQFQTDPRTQPIEDATVEWKERESPYVAVARIRIPRQIVDQAETQAQCESMAFNPWHALPAHRPLGNMNRARKDIYKAMSAFRAQGHVAAAGVSARRTP
jgi:catalase